ncbi:MAG: hypothetical protein Q8O56_07445 [Solirubrobacteraceae bacterium]|nr:hypothetical protein [Solirubrobacteraceae bacterium]
MTASFKARRLLAEQRLFPIGAATAYTVVGDDGTYRVVIGDGWAMCPCPEHRELCTHVEAALLLDAALCAEGLAGVAA